MPENWRARLESTSGPNAKDEEAEFLPIHQSRAFAESDERDHSTPFNPLEPILIVDDDVNWEQSCSFSLRQMGYAPFIAKSSGEALDLFLAHGVSIAIIDYSLQGLDGVSLVKKMEELSQQQGRQLRFIMAAGNATKDVAVEAIRASAVDFLEKPITDADLRRALQRAGAAAPSSSVAEALLDKIALLSVELQRFARVLDDGANETKPIAREATVAPRNASDIPLSALTGFIRDLLRKETRRRQIGGGELFGDPAWAMLLDLLLAKIEGRRVSVSSACIASGAPMSTALRLVRRLVDDKVLTRLPDEHDRRRHFLVVNAKFEDPLVEYLKEQFSQEK